VPKSRSGHARLYQYNKMFTHSTDNQSARLKNMCFLGDKISCSCNLNHNYCNNNTCETDLQCQRAAKFINNVTIIDEQLCVKDTIGNHCHVAEKQVYGNNVTILVRLCCRESGCNSNDTLLWQYVKEELGTFVCVCVHACVCVWCLACGVCVRACVRVGGWVG